MSVNLDRAANLAIATAALVLAAIFARREFQSRASQQGDRAPAVATYYSDWAELDSGSVPLDTNKGVIRVYVFSDLECPFCAAFHAQVVPMLYRKYADAVSIRFVHFPLKGHRFSRQAAAAFECASDQGRSLAFLDATYSKQDSIGLVSWSSIASAARVPDSARFISCVTSPPSSRIARGESLGNRFDVMSTPTIIVNGWRFTGLPDSSSFLSALDSIKVGGNPLVTASAR